LEEERGKGRGQEVEGKKGKKKDREMEKEYGNGGKSGDKETPDRLCPSTYWRLPCVYQHECKVTIIDYGHQ